MGESSVGSPLWPLTERTTHKLERKRARVSAPNKEYLIAKATLCHDLAITQILAGEGEEASRNLMRMVKALGEVGIINEREGKDNE
jgi:hypothetical protein